MGEVPCPGWAAVGVQEVEGEPRLGQVAVEAVVGERRPELGSLHLASEEGVAAWQAQASRWSQAPGQGAAVVVQQRESSGQEKQPTCRPWKTVGGEGPWFRTE